MTLAFFMDVHVRRAISDGLRRAGVDVLTAQDDGSTRLPDPELLDRATELGQVLFSQDDDLLREATEHQELGRSFSGVVYAHQLRITVGQAIRDLQLIAEVYEPEDIASRVEYLPL